MARKSTILTPPVEGKPKPEALVDVNVQGYRSRATLPSPFGDAEPPFEGTEAEVLARAAADEIAGMAPVVERRIHGIGWVTYRNVPTIRELALKGLAREIAPNVFRYTPEGQRVTFEAMGL